MYRASGSLFFPPPARLALALAASLAPLAACSPEPGGGERITLAAAASLRRVTPALVEAFNRRHPGVEVRVTYGASGSLRRQVEVGAPVDAVLFAGSQPVDRLIELGLARATSRRVVAANAMVLIGPPRAAALSFSLLPELSAGERLAIGDPALVPAGRYAREALQNLGVWDKLAGRLVFGNDVTQVLAYARRGEVEAAIVYATDLIGIDDVKVLDWAAGPWAPRPQVVAAAVGRASGPGRDKTAASGQDQTAGAATTTAARSQAAAAWLDFLASAPARAIFADFGFSPPPTAEGERS